MASHPVQTFAGIVTNPMLVHKFEIAIPSITNNIPLIVESTQFPTQGKYREVDLWQQGFQIRYPALPENGGTWQFTIPESANGVVSRTFHELLTSFYDQVSGVMLPSTWQNISVFAKDPSGENVVFHSILHGAWLAQKQPVALNAATPGTPWKNVYVWVYQWIEDKKVGNNMQFANPMK